MKVYISIPISGIKMDVVRFNERHAKEQIIQSKNTPVSPLDINPDPTKPYAEMCGKDIQALLECDAIYFCRGWERSKGCTAEYEVAKIFNKVMLFE